MRKVIMIDLQPNVLSTLITHIGVHVQQPRSQSSPGNGVIPINQQLG
jgi:hypothetical protein